MATPPSAGAGGLRRVFVIGVGMTRFEKPGRRDWDYPDMARIAGVRALRDAGLNFREVQLVAVGYCYGDSTAGQRAVYQLGELGVPVINTNNNCSTGSTALYIARQSVAGGLADCAMALGFEKMQPGSLGSLYTDRTNPLDRHLQTMLERHELGAGPVAPQMFGNAAVEHMEEHGSTREHYARIAWKNHKHSVANPYSQFRDEYSLEQVLASPDVHGPLTKLQCCPTSDGAAAALVASYEFVVAHGLQGVAVEITGQSMATDLPSSFQRSSIKVS
jgi:acetyl-CoA acetyltransferase